MINRNKKKNVLVHFHLYYHDQLDYFISKLKNINDCNWDLYVTVTQNNEKSEEKILKFKPNAKIIKVNNIGYDVWPFIQVLRICDIKQYDMVLKLHTKCLRAKPHNLTGFEMLNYDWRNYLVEALLKNRFVFRKNLNKLSGDEIGIVVDKKLLRTVEGSPLPEDTYLLDILKDRLQIKVYFPNFIAGTMFFAKSDIFTKIIESDIKESDFAANSSSASVGSLAHALERIFCALAVEKGYRLYLSKASKIKKRYFYIGNHPSSNNKWYKVIYLFGVKISIRNKKKERQVAKEKEQILQ